MDEMGLSLLDIMMITDNYPTFIEIFSKLDILSVNEHFVDACSHKVFHNLKVHLRTNKYLNATNEFLKALADIPGIGLLIRSKYLIKYRFFNFKLIYWRRLS